VMVSVAKPFSLCSSFPCRFPRFWLSSAFLPLRSLFPSLHAPLEFANVSKVLPSRSGRRDNQGVDLIETHASHQGAINLASAPPRSQRQIPISRSGVCLRSEVSELFPDGRPPYRGLPGRGTILHAATCCSEPRHDLVSSPRESPRRLASRRVWLNENKLRTKATRNEGSSVRQRSGRNTARTSSLKDPEVSNRGQEWRTESSPEI
jgi:hypothetical protein